MNLPPAVTVHGLAHARAALLLGLPVTLLSAPFAGVYAGAGWWLGVIAAACAGDAQPPHILDCGHAAGRAVEAARAGQKLIVLKAPATLLADVRGVAMGYGATVLDIAPPSLDLAAHGGARGLPIWLAEGKRPADHTTA